MSVTLLHHGRPGYWPSPSNPPIMKPIAKSKVDLLGELRWEENSLGDNICCILSSSVNTIVVARQGVRESQFSVN
jgi:hypothetical protein